MSDSMRTGTGLTVGELRDVARKWMQAEDPMERIVMGQSAHRTFNQVDYTPTVKEELRPMYRAMADAAGVKITYSDEKGFVPESYGSSFRPRYNFGERDCMIKGDGYNVAVFEMMLQILREPLPGMRKHLLNPPAPDTEYEGYDFRNEEADVLALAEVSAEMEVPYHSNPADPGWVHVGPTGKLEEFLAKVYVRARELRNRDNEPAVE